MRTKPGKLRRTLALSILAAALVAAGSWGLAAQTKKASGAITIWVGSWWAPQLAITHKLWQADNPEITLNIEPLPINGYLDKFITAALGGTPPDIIDLDSTC